MWCVVANVKPEAYGRATSAGTRHFAAGAKLWCLPVSWGDGYERVRVVGRHRGSKLHVLMVVPSARLTNWRAKVAYHPEVVRLLEQHGRWPDQAACEAAARVLARAHPPVDDLRAHAAHLNAALRALDEPRGRELEALAAAALERWQTRDGDAVPPIEVIVLADWLEQRGLALPIRELVTTLDRRRANR